VAAHGNLGAAVLSDGRGLARAAAAVTSEPDCVRVLFVDSSIGALGNLGGDGRSLLQLVKGLSDLGVEVGICGVCSSARLDAYGAGGARTFMRLRDAAAVAPYRRLRVGVAGGAMTKALLSRHLLSAMNEFRPDLVHANLFQKWDGFDLHLARRMGVRTVAHLRSLGSQVTLGRFDVAACDVIVAVSDVVRKFAQESFPRSRVVRIYDPVDAAAYHSDLDRPQARARLDLAQDLAPLLVSVAALDPRKGHDLAIRALAEIRAVGVPARLVIAGAAYDVGDSSELNRLQRLAQEVGVPDAVVFVGNVERMSDLYAAADVVFALSHDGEALGRVPIEAAFARRPVVATAAGATPEIVDNERTGLLVRPGHVGDTVRQTLRLLHEPALVAALVRAAADRASTQFALDRSSTAMLGLYRVLLDERAGQTRTVRR
jgi:glycosyltransferase involved in cell wall biosynthesis